MLKLLKKIFNDKEFFNIVKMPFYAVAQGRKKGIYMNWTDCEAQVKGFPGAKYKKFNLIEQAKDFLANSNSSTTQNIIKCKDNVTHPNLKRNHSSIEWNSDGNERKKTPTNLESKCEKIVSEESDDFEPLMCKYLDELEEKGDLDTIIEKSENTSCESTTNASPPSKRTKNSNFQIDNEGFTHVFTDGACSANGCKGARAGLGVFWGDDHHLNISEPVSGRATNNCGEIQAATRAIRQALDNGITKLAINTDSQFVINSVTKWMKGWKRKGWKLKSGKPVKNEIDFKELDELLHKLEVKWLYVEAHRGIHGNEMADQLARMGAAMYNAE